MYNNREEFINDTISEKITLAHVSCSTRLYDFQTLSTNVYSKVTDYIVTNISNFTKASSQAVALNEFYFDVSTRTLYIGTDQDIDNTKIIATYRLFFSDAPINLTWDLQDQSVEVEYEPRLLRSPQLKSSVGNDQKGISLTSSGNVELENTDGYFDDIYDLLVFDNKVVEVYSTHRDLKPSEAKIIFRGNIYDKSFTSSSVTLQVKDNYTRLEESIVLPKYELSDGVSLSDVDKFKRRLYGRLDGVLIKSVDQLSQGYSITGTVSSNLNDNATVTGIDTLFVSQQENGVDVFNVGDTIEIEEQEFTIESIASETEMVISSEEPIYLRAEEISYDKLTKTQLSGAVSTTILQPKTVTGSATSFTTDFTDGDRIQIRDNIYNIKNVISDTELEIEINVQEEVNSSIYLKLETISGDGSVSFLPPARYVTGTSTQFLDELTIDDKLTISGTQYIIEDIISDTELILSDDVLIVSDFTNQSATNITETAWRKKNRTFQIAHHALAESETTITQALELNKIVVDDATNIESGDILTIFNGATVFATLEVLRVSSNNITARFNLPSLPDIGFTVKKQPVFNVFSNGNELLTSDIVEIDNQSTGSFLTLSELSEFNIAESKTLTSIRFQFVNGSREVRLATTFSNLTETVSTRDFIKGRNDADLYFAEILKVDDTKITLRTPYQGQTAIKALVYKNVDTIGDTSAVSCNCVGKTKDGLPNGELIKTGPEIIKDLFSEIVLDDFLDQSSILKASENAPYLMSLSIPQTITDTSLPTIKTLVDKVNRSIFGSMTISNDLRIQYSILDVARPDVSTLRTIRFDDIINWSIKSKSGNLYKKVNVEYSRRDYSNITKEVDYLRYTIDSDFAIDFDTSNKTDDIILYVYKDDEALELSERYVYINTLAQNTIELTSDLRLSDIDIGQKIILELPRLYKRLGDLTARSKVVTVTGFRVSGKNIKLTLSDLGNLYNRSSIISDNNSDEYDIIDSVSKLNTTFITDENGAINNDYVTQNTNLIY